MAVKKITEVFYSECSKMKGSISRAESADATIQPNDIVTMYYQVTNVSAMASALKNGSMDAELHVVICDAERLISEKFDSIVHPRMKEIISKMVQKEMTELQSAIQKETEYGTDAKYDNLRSAMSIKEFIGQYDTMIGGASNE